LKELGENLLAVGRTGVGCAGCEEGAVDDAIAEAFASTTWGAAIAIYIDAANKKKCRNSDK